jgi:hypothetical protein
MPEDALEQPLLHPNLRRYMTSYLSTFILGGVVALSLAVVGYLTSLQIREIRRNRRMDAERERLGLRRA